MLTFLLTSVLWIVALVVILLIVPPKTIATIQSKVRKTAKNAANKIEDAT